MKKTLLLLLIAAVLVFQSCIEKPDACFSIPTDTIITLQEIQLLNCSQNADNFLWFIYDENDEIILNSSAHNPYLSWTKAGYYRIELQAFTNEKDNKSSQEREITVFSASELISGKWSINYPSENQLSEILKGLNPNSVVLKINEKTFCSFSLTQDSVFIDPQYFWNTDFEQILSGYGIYNSSYLSINLLLKDSLGFEQLLVIEGEKLSFH